jgi:hypothetical protein
MHSEIHFVKEISDDHGAMDSATREFIFERGNLYLTIELFYEKSDSNR